MKILVPVGGSENAFRALDLACKLAADDDELLLLNVVGRGELPEELKRYAQVEHIEGPPQWQYEQLVASEMINAALERLRARGVQNIDTFVRTGDVARTINAVADEAGAGLIVMGAYGHSRFREMVLGGATHDLLRHMTVPVLMAH